MLNKRLILMFALIVISPAFAACAPPATPIIEPTVEVPAATQAAPTAEVTEPPTQAPTEAPTVTPTAAGPTGGLPVQGGASEAISTGNVDRLTKLSSLPLPTSINTLAFTPNGATLAASTPDGVGLFDVATGQQTNTLAQGTPVWAMAFSADSLKLAMIPSEQGTPPIIWDLAANAPSSLLADQLAGVASIGFSADHTAAATGSSTGVVTVYRLESDSPPALWNVDINSLQMVIDLQFGAPIPVTNVVFSTDGTQLAASSAGLGVLVIFNASDGSVASSGSAMGHIAGPVATALLAPTDWSKVYWLSRAEVIAVDLATDQEAGRFSHEDFVQGIAFSADGGLLATASGATINGTFQPVILLWDTSSHRGLWQITGFAQIPPALAFSPDGSKLAVGVNGEGVSLWGLVQNQ